MLSASSRSGLLMLRGLGRCRALSSSSAAPRVAVVLSGSGVYDGSEITEAVSALVALSRSGAETQCFAPDAAQLAVVNHVTGEDVETETRNVLLESARIARGNVQPLQELRAEDYAAVVFPGGFGAAKNLCDFAVKGPDFTVDSEVERVVGEFHAQQKPIGMCCIAPILAARLLPAVSLTLGHGSEDADAEQWPFAGAAGAAQACGATHVDCDVDAVHVDVKNKLTTAPAYMKGTAAPHEVADNVTQLVSHVLSMIE